MAAYQTQDLYFNLQQLRVWRPKRKTHHYTAPEALFNMGTMPTSVPQLEMAMVMLIHKRTMRTLYPTSVVMASCQRVWLQTRTKEGIEISLSSGQELHRVLVQEVRTPSRGAPATCP